MNLFETVFNPKKPRKARTMQKVVYDLFVRDNEELQHLDEEERDLYARLRELHNVRSRIMNQSYLQVPTWDDKFPVMCTIELGGPSNTMSITGGRNAESLNATLLQYSGLPDKMGGNTVRALMSKLVSIATGACKEPALEEDATLQICMQGLITLVLQLSSDGVRSVSGCVLEHSNQATDKVAKEDSKESKKPNKINEVQILFTHLLAWVMESIPNCKACMDDAWLSQNGQPPVPLNIIWRVFNTNVIKQAKQDPDLLTKVRFNKRSVLYCLMPERIEKDDSQSQQKAADLKSFGLMHRQSKESWFVNQPDAFLQSLILLDQCKKKAEKAGAPISEAQESKIQSRASAKSWPGDLSRVQSKTACASTVASFVRGTLQYPSSAKTPQEMQFDGKLFLDTFKSKVQGGQLLTEIVADSKVSFVHKQIVIW